MIVFPELDFLPALFVLGVIGALTLIGAACCALWYVATHLAWIA